MPLAKFHYFSQKTNTKLSIKGRHDPCMVPRGSYCVEVVMAITLLDLML
ncbi:chorismate synthase [Desulforamulus reducens]